MSVVSGPGCGMVERVVYGVVILLWGVFFLVSSILIPPSWGTTTVQ
jgi:hypothetical protein